MIKSMTDHIGSNLWLWTAVGMAVAVLAAIGQGWLGRGYYLAEIMTLGAMFAGTLLIMISQQGMPAAAAPEEEA
jgi:hypothetical protein